MCNVNRPRSRPTARRTTHKEESGPATLRWDREGARWASKPRLLVPRGGFREVRLSFNCLDSRFAKHRDPNYKSGLSTDIARHNRASVLVTLASRFIARPRLPPEFRVSFTQLRRFHGPRIGRRVRRGCGERPADHHSAERAAIRSARIRPALPVTRNPWTLRLVPPLFTRILPVCSR